MRQLATGFLLQLNENDARNTDLYFFRESDGSLITERLGLTEEEIKTRWQSTQWNSEDADFYEGYGGELRQDNPGLFNKFSYQIFLRGPDDERGAGGGRSDYSDWANANGMIAPALQDREGDLVKPGESIRIVAINRATGYVGTARHVLGSGNAGITEEIPQINMAPPNLRVWAERKSITQHGGTSGESHTYLIGNESAGTQQDQYIALYTHWLDADGSALPAGLDDTRGLQGRVARVFSDNYLSAANAIGNDSATFAITPGLKTQHLSVFSNLKDTEHYYLHVVGQPKGMSCAKPDVSCADFSTDPTAPAPYTHRPKLFTPILTPIADEQQSLENLCLYQQIKRAHDLSGEDAQDAGQVCGDLALSNLQGVAQLQRPQASYGWQYRPEYQFSVYDLDVKALNIGKDDNNNGLIDDNAENILEAYYPIIPSDHYLQLFYSLYAPEYPALPSIDSGLELVFNLAGMEVHASISENQQISFMDLSVLELLSPETYFTLQLINNQDPGNVLWEYAFKKNGLHYSYKLPHEERNARPVLPENSLPDGQSVDDELASINQLIVRTLGGVRLKYYFVVPGGDGGTLENISWQFRGAGAFCQSYEQSSASCTPVGESQAQSYELKGTGPLQHKEIWWEPRTGISAAEVLWSNNLNVSGTLKATYRDVNGKQHNFNQEFVVRSRELRPPPVLVQEEPMQGEDVAMLESMLWQLGLSPQHDFPGSRGDRLGDFSPTLQGFIGGYAGAEGRSRFSKGMIGASGSGSMERMVQRFKNRSFESTGDGIKGIASSQNAVVDNATLQQLGFVWRDYSSAVQAAPQTNYLFSDIPQVQWTGLVNAMAGTVDFTFPEPQQVQTELVYDNAVHQSAMRARGNSDVTREALMRAWVSKENNRHWGANNTPFRISEGGGDEVGSIGFSQIWFAYMYGAVANCEALNNINMYHPNNNLLGFAVWAGIDDCDGSFYRAFHTEDYTLPNDPQTTDRLVGYQCTENSEGIAQANGICPYTPDNYERLVKGLVGYNVGKFGDRLVSCTLPEMLAGGVIRPNNRPGKAGKTINCQASTRKSGKQLDYGLTILHGTLPQTTPPDTNKLALPYRSYIWFGGTNPADMTMVNEQGEVVPHPQAGQDWCFAYGEQEWREPQTIVEVGQPNRLATFEDYKTLAEEDENRRVPCQ